MNICLYGQKFYLTNISTDDGLPSSETYETLQDSKGYIWITTDAGLCRFDGKNITTFTTKDGISENVVFRIREDSKGRVWFSTLSGYFFYYDYSDASFHRIAANPELKKICGRYLVYSFFVGNNDTLFCYTPSNYGLLKIPPQDNYGQVIVTPAPTKGQRYIVQNDKNRNEFITCLDPGGKITEALQVYFKNRVFTIPRAERIVPLTSANNQVFTYLDKQEDLYVFDYADLDIINLKSGRIKKYTFPATLNTMLIDKDGDLWISMGREGGRCYRNGDLNSTPITFLPGCQIAHFMMDREGTMWISTVEKGIYMILNKNIFNVPVPDKVVDFCKYGDELYAGLTSKDKIKVSGNSPDFRIVPQETAIGNSSTLRAFYISSKLNFYSTQNGLYVTKDHRSFSAVSDATMLMSLIVSKQLLPLDGDTVLALNSGGVCLLYQDHIIESWPQKLDINVFTRLADGRVIAGSRNDEGIFEFKNGGLIPFLPSFGQLKARINCMQEDRQGDLWIGTNEKGIFCYSKNKLYGFNQKSGLETDKVNTIAFDAAGRLWLGTARGISLIDYSKGIEKPLIANFDKSNGLPDLEVQKITEYHGAMWCASKNDLFYFESGRLQPDVVPPLIYIKSVTVNNHFVELFSSPVLQHDQNNFNISFDGLTYKNTETKGYLYRLEGYNPEWMLTNSGQIQFTNLPAGEYTFMVCALNNNNVRSKTPAAFHFTILKPFWLTWWFITLMILLGISLVIAFIYWRITKIRIREDQKTLFNKKIAEFHLTAVRAQMNPHFLFNAISSIQHYILSNDVYKSYDYLAKFSLLIRNVLDNSQEEFILLSKEIDTLKLYIELEQIRFNEPFSYVINVEGDLSTDSTFIPTMLIQPYIENAIWHGLMPKQNDCSLELTFKKADHKLHVLIKDNGVGRNKRNKTQAEKQHKSKGLDLTAQRLHALGVKTDRDFQVEITDLTDGAGNGIGTEVRLLIPLISDHEDD
ncbi:MAG: signal transduction histidine kinase, LytS [Bacteroidetes bacterium]|nr:signal transduction histidine kinase, LytS [Bacteroidota bacterium]